MYGLCTHDLSFWEEDPGTGHCGVQESLSVTQVNGGICQHVLWREESGRLHTYEEVRTIGCKLDSCGHGVTWTWKSERTALRDHQLVQSKWAHAAQDGCIINYHGLGIRLPWMWCYGEDNHSFGGLEINGEPARTEEAHGCKADHVGMWGLIDGQWQRTEARVILTQNEGFAWYAVRGPFPYLATGPSGEGTVDVTAGQTFTENYTLRVADKGPESKEG